MRLNEKSCRNCEYCIKTDKGLYCSHREGNPKVTGGGWCIDRQDKVQKMEILNAKITSTSITMADHGYLTFWVTIEGGGWGVSIGGYKIGDGYIGADQFSGYGPGLEAMMRIMDVVGVDKWEDLKDKYIRVESNGWGERITKIGHITNNKWFDIDEFFKSKKETRNEKE